MRRDKNDKEWAKVKHAIKERDGNTCRLVRKLSVGEMYELKQNAGVRYKTLDPAHIYPVSLDTSVMYEPANLVILNRYSHEMLDSMKSPLTGKSIPRSEVYKWWKRIAGDKQWYEIQRLRDLHKKEKRMEVAEASAAAREEREKRNGNS